MTTPKQSQLDRAVIAYREQPTDANRAALMAAQRSHTVAFMQRETADFIRRTR